MSDRRTCTNVQVEPLGIRGFVFWQGDYRGWYYSDITRRGVRRGTRGTEMSTTYHVEHAAELCGPVGPTGEFVEVVKGEVRDHGGNVLFAGTAAECASERKKWRIPTRLVPTATRRLDGEIAGADNTWGYA